MAIQTTLMRNALASAYATNASYGALYTTVPGAGAGTELVGGSPAYVRKAPGWGAAASSAVTGTVTYDVPAGSTIAGTGVHSAVSGTGNYLDGTSVTSQAFSSQGTYALTLTYTQT